MSNQTDWEMEPNPPDVPTSAPPNPERKAPRDDGHGIQAVEVITAADGTRHAIATA